MASERQYWLGFNRVAGVGPARLQRLLELCGTLEAAWNASPRELKHAGLDTRAVANMQELRKSIDLESELAKLDGLGVALLTWDDPDYPAMLTALRPAGYAPPLLYVRGTLAADDEWAIAIVGTRNVSAYGRQVTYQIASHIASAGMTVISGLAHGVDTEAHTAALDVGARTIAVLPCGIDEIYPPENRKLARRIAEQGALVSTFPLGTAPEAKNFAPRNRVISGLARGVLVTEAGVKSGAVLTAGYALEQGREVFAVPGNITSHGSGGTNRLIQDGAVPTLTAQDILDALGMSNIQQFSAARVELPNISADEQSVIAALSGDAMHVDELSRKSGLPVASVASALTLLELKGMVRQAAPMTYVRL